MKRVIYTALTRGYDELRQPEFIHPDYDYICFSNDFDAERMGVWQIRKIAYDNPERVRVCRYVKLHPHLFLPEYQYSLWLDCNQRLTAEHHVRMERCIAGRSICAMVLHPERDCVYQEAYCCTNGLNDSPDNIYRQTEFLLSEDFPARAGLYVTCCVFRKHNERKIVEFDELWWSVLERYSYRDQMSVMYALRRSGVVPDIFHDRGYWEKFRYEHAGGRPHRSFMRRASDYIYRRLMMFRLALLLKRHGIRDFNWKKVELIRMS